MRVFKNVRKYAGYCLLYLFITLIAAIGSLFLLSAVTSRGSTGKKVTLAPQISKIYNNLSTKEALHLGANIVIGSENQLGLKFESDIKINNKEDDVQLQGNIELNLNDDILPLNFCFQDKNLYIDLCNAKFTLNTSDLSNSLDQILTSLGFSLSSLDIDIQDLTLENLLGTLSDLEERIEDDAVILDVEVPLFGKSQIICDLDYNMQSLIIPPSIINEMPIAIDLNLTYPSSVEIQKPQEQYLDISSMFDVVSSAISYFTKDNFGLEINFNKGDLNFTGNLYASLKDMTIKYEMDLLGQNARLFVIDKVLYIELGNLNLKFDLNALPDALDILNSHFNLNLPAEFVRELLTSSKEELLNLNFAQLLTGEKNSSLADLDLNIVESFTKVDNVCTLKLKDMGRIDFILNNGNFECLTYNVNDLSVIASSIPAKNITLSSGQARYIDIAKTLPAIDAAISTTEEDYILAEGFVSFAGASGDIVMAADLKNFQINLKLAAFGKEILIDYLDDNAFLHFDDIYLRGTKEEILSLIERLGVNFSPDTIIDTLKVWLDPEKNESFVKDIETGENNLIITLLNGAVITLFYDTKITKVEIALGTTQITLNLTYPQSQIEFSPINEEKYSPASIVLEKIFNLYQYIQNKTFYLDIAGNTALNNIHGFVNYENGKLEASIEIENDNNFLGIIIKDQTVYLRINEDLVSFPINDFKEALNILKSSITPDIAGLVDKIDINYLLEDILKSLILKIEQDKILFAYNDLKLNVCFENDKPCAVQIEGLDFGGMITINDSAHKPPQFDKEKYSSFTTLIEKATALNEYIKASEHYIVLNANYKEFDIEGILNHQGENLSALLEVKSGNTSFSIKLQDSVIYIDYKNLHISCDSESCKELLKLLSEEFGGDLTEVICKIIDNVKFDSSLIDKVLTRCKLNFTDDKLTFGFDKVLAEITFKDNMIANAKLNYSDFTLLASINSSPANIERVNEDIYLPLNSLMGQIQSVLTIIKNKQLYLQINANYSSLNFTGYLNIDKSGISLLASTQIDGVVWEIKFIENVIYLEKNNLKLQFALDQIDKVKQFLTYEFNFDLTSISNISIDFANIFENANLKFEDNALKFEYRDLTGQINFNEQGIAGINVNYQDLNVAGNIVANKKEIEVKGKYTQLETLLPFVTAFKNYISSKQYDITANATVYEKDTQIYSAQDMLFQLDLTEKIKFYASALVSGVRNTKTAGFYVDLSACGDQTNVYVDYNGLGLKISQNDFEKIIHLALSLFNMNSLSTIADNLLNGREINLSQIMDIVTQNTSEISLSYINLLEKIDVEGNALKIVIDGNVISSTAKATQMEIALYTNNGVLSQISFKNFYTGVTSNEHFDFTVYFNDFNGVTAPSTDKKYIDFSGSGDLIEAFLNTATSYKTFEISGSLNIKLKIGVISIDWNLSIKIQIRLVNGKIELQASIGVIPVIDLMVYNLNNDSPWRNKLFDPLSIKNRTLTIYYKDNYFYFYRQEARNGGDCYQKALKAHIDSVFDDILYYVKWGTGFNDDVIGAIKKSMNQSESHTPDLNNIINSFTCLSLGENKFYSLNLNLNELTGDDKMGDLKIGASVKNLNGKNVVSGFSFNLDMPLIWGTTLYMKADPLSITHGASFDMTAFDKYIKAFSKGKESVEYSSINGIWERDGEKLYTVKFETGFDDLVLPEVRGSVNSRFILKKFEDKVIGTKHEGIDYTIYTFAGWYTNKNFSEGSKVTRGVIPAKNITLYAKWVIKEGYRTISYYNNGNLITTEYALVNSPLRTDIINKYVEYEQNDILYKQEFIGWKDKNGVAVDVVPEESESLYADYQTYQALNKRTLTIVQGIGGDILTLPVFETQSLNDYMPARFIPVTQNGTTSIYEFKGWFTDSRYTTPAPTVMPTHDLTVYAKWNFVKVAAKQYELKIYDNDKLYSAFIEENMPITFADNMPIYSTTRWYSDSNCLILTSRPILMPNHDVTFYIKNKYNISYTYYVLEYGQFTAKTYSAELYQGSKFTLHKLVDFEETIKIENVPIKRVGYYFQGYKTIDGKSIDSNIVPNHDLTFNATYTTQSKSYFKLSFHYDWVKPAWWINGGSEVVTGQLKDIYVLEGSYIIGTTLYSVVDLQGSIQERAISVNAERKYGLKYSFNSAAWNTTACKNLYNSAFGNARANSSRIDISSDTDLYIEWQHI